MSHYDYPEYTHSPSRGPPHPLGAPEHYPPQPYHSVQTPARSHPPRPLRHLRGAPPPRYMTNAAPFPSNSKIYRSPNDPPHHALPPARQVSRSISGYVSRHPASRPPPATAAEQHYYKSPAPHGAHPPHHYPPRLAAPVDGGGEPVRYSVPPGSTGAVPPSSYPATAPGVDDYHTAPAAPLYRVQYSAPGSAMGSRDPFTPVAKKSRHSISTAQKVYYNGEYKEVGSSLVEIGGNALSFIPPGFAHSLHIQFPDSRLPVCEICKKYYKTRDSCRLRNRHKGLPWSTIYLCVTLDESCIGADGKSFTQGPIASQVLSWQPFCCKRDLDPTTPVCAACKHKNYTKSFCRGKHKHRHLPWSTVYLLVRAVEGTNEPPAASCKSSTPLPTLLVSDKGAARKAKEGPEYVDNASDQAETTPSVSKSDTVDISSHPPIVCLPNVISSNVVVQDGTKAIKVTKSCENDKKDTPTSAGNVGASTKDASESIDEIFESHGVQQEPVKQLEESLMKENDIKGSKTSEEQNSDFRSAEVEPRLEANQKSKYGNEEKADDITSMSSSVSGDYDAEEPEICGESVSEIDKSRTFLLEVSQSRVRLQWLDYNEMFEKEGGEEAGTIRYCQPESYPPPSRAMANKSEVAPILPPQHGHSYPPKTVVDTRYEYYPPSRRIPPSVPPPPQSARAHYISRPHPRHPKPPPAASTHRLSSPGAAPCRPRYYPQPAKQVVTTHSYSPPPHSGAPLKHYLPPHAQYSSSSYHEESSPAYYDKCDAPIPHHDDTPTGVVDTARCDHHSYPPAHRPPPSVSHHHLHSEGTTPGYLLSRTRNPADEQGPSYPYVPVHARHPHNEHLSVHCGGPPIGPPGYRGSPSRAPVYQGHLAKRDYPQPALSEARVSSGPYIQRHASVGSSSAYNNRHTAKNSSMEAAEAAIARMVAYNYENEESLQYSHVSGDVARALGGKHYR